MADDAFDDESGEEELDDEMLSDEGGEGEEAAG